MAEVIKPSVETWNNFWSEADIIDREPNLFLINTIKEVLGESLVGKMILEVGSGASSEATELAKQGAKVSVLDFSPHAIDILRRSAKGKGVSLFSVRADAERIPFSDNTFDLVYSQGLIEHFLPPDELMKEQVRIVKPGGFILVDVPQLFSSQAIVKKVLMTLNKWPCGWERNYAEEQLRALFEHFGLKPVTAYAWGYLPPISLEPDIRKQLKSLVYGFLNKKGAADALSQDNNNLMPKFQKTWLARHLLNCIGIVAQKPLN